MLQIDASGRRLQLRVRALLLWLALLAMPASLPAPSRALSIADITPLYFDGAGGQGFSPASVAAQGLAPSFRATPNDLWLLVGASQSGRPIEIDQALGARTVPSQPSFATPVIADSTWTVHNRSGSDLKAPLLVFLSVDPDGVYPIALPPTGLDANLLSLLSYSFADLVYGVARLPDLAAGASADITVRYVVAGALAPGDPAPLPPLSVVMLGSYQIVPEPSTAVLLAAGLLGLAAAARPRRA